MPFLSLHCSCFKPYILLQPDKIIRGEECAVCLDPIDNGQSVVKFKKCDHQYHRLCADEISRVMRSCPLCGGRLEKINVCTLIMEVVSDQIVTVSERFDRVSFNLDLQSSHNRQPSTRTVTSIFEGSMEVSMERTNESEHSEPT